MSTSINRVIILGNLTRDPGPRIAGGTHACSLRIAVSDRIKDPVSGEWGEKPNYFDVEAFGALGEACATKLTKGRQVAIEGRLRYREWLSPQGQKRSAISIVAEAVQFLGLREGEASVGRSAASAQVSAWPEALQPDDDSDDDILF